MLVVSYSCIFLCSSYLMFADICWIISELVCLSWLVALVFLLLLVLFPLFFLVFFALDFKPMVDVSFGGLIRRDVYLLYWYTNFRLMLFLREFWVYNVVAYWFLVYWILGVAKTNFGSPYRNKFMQKIKRSNIKVGRAFAVSLWCW